MKLPKRFAQPAVGLTIETEPDEQKAARILGMFRWMTARNVWTMGVSIDGAQYMIVRYRPKPAGPHPPEADLRGSEL